MISNEFQQPTRSNRNLQPASSFLHYDDCNDTDETSSYKTLDINLTHPIRCTQLAIDYFVSQKRGGVVIHISSAAAQYAYPNIPLYIVSKAGVSSFVRCMAPLDETMNIRVVAVAPGQVQTPLWDEAERTQVVDESRGDSWIAPQEVSDLMMKLVAEEGFPGGSVTEMGKEHTRKVEMLNDPGPDVTKPGLKLSNTAPMIEKMQYLLAKNFGKAELSPQQS